MMVWLCQKQGEGECLLKVGGRKDYEARKEKLASCAEVVLIPTLQCNMLKLKATVLIYHL